jgi:hypothetical protein
MITLPLLASERLVLMSSIWGYTLRILSVTEEEYDDGLFSYHQRHTDTLRLTGTWRPVVTLQVHSLAIRPTSAFQAGVLFRKS